MKNGFSPILDKHTEFLILGSLPSDESIRKQEYYANPKNQFWKILGAVFNVDLNNISYDNKIAELKKLHIGLWDVYSKGSRKGSLDSAITGYVLNDFSYVKNYAPNLKVIYFNGKKAFSHATDIDLNIKKICLTSTSPANTISLTSKIEQWSILSK